MNKQLFFCICIVSLILSIIYLYLIKFGGTMSKVDTVINNSTILVKNVEHENFQLVIHSAFYYKTSKLYSPNSLIILINGKRGAETMNFQCHSKNSTSSSFTEAQIRVAEPGPYCKWISYIINCTTVIDPNYIGLSMDNSSKIIDIKFELPVKEKYPVIMCYPPMVYESRWQQIIFATEIYHYFGTDLQIQYINSAMKEIVDLLEIYEKKKWIKIAKFAFIDFNATVLDEIGYPPMFELDSRNQPIAYTDCMMKYRESSEFIIVADVDDVLIPQGTNYFKEFSHWRNIYPFAAAFMYYRAGGAVNATNSFGNFSLFNTLSTLNVQDGNAVGKSVYQTAKAESAWIHWPFFKNETTATIVPKHGKMLHVGIGDVALKKFQIMPPKELQRVSFEFSKTFKGFPSFTSNTLYAQAIAECYGGSGSWNSTTRPCLTPLQCPKPKNVKGFKCNVAKRKFSRAFLNESISFFIPSSDYFWDKLENGCNLFVN